MTTTTRRTLKYVMTVLFAAMGSGLLLWAQNPQPIGTWEAIGAIPDARANAASVALPDGRTLIAGGTNVAGELLNTVVIYDPAARTFAAAGQLTSARSGLTATLLKDGRVLLAGGQTASGVSTSLEIFDIESGSS
ncbi:MAG TPA: kelch repeat-containing protein, partial [Vicinamibacterales bacterium]|nr:kelch repeat-containing protein [Vicinamibacterales bacterium]